MPDIKFSGRGSIAISVTGTDKLKAQLAKLKGAGPIILARAVHEEAETILDVTVEKYIPRDTSALAGSRYAGEPVVRPGYVRVVFGFGGAGLRYAWKTHENPRAGKTGGVSPTGRRYKHWADVGEWKYLEKAVARMSRGFSRRVGARISREWKALLG